MSEQEKTATCACGALSVVVRGQPTGVYGCACGLCQRRSGGAFTHTAMYDDPALVARSGTFTTWRRTDDNGFWTEHDFCTVCGSRLLVRMLDQPGKFGVSVGCFADPDFPAPQVMIWSSMLHKWLNLPEGIERLPSFTR